MTQRRVFWTGRELREVAQRMLELRAVNADTSNLRIAQEAQKCLPADRQRSIVGNQHILNLLRTFRNLQQDEAKKPAVPAEPEAPAPTVEPPSESRIFADRIPQVLVPVMLPEPEDTLEQLIDKFAERFAIQVTSKIQAALQLRAATLLQQVVKEIVHGDIQKKRSVLLVGPKQDQGTMLKHEFSKLLDLRVIDKDHLPHAHVAAQTVDYIVLWVDFISHQVQHTMPKEKTFLVRGGMDALRTKLKEIYCL